MSTIRIAVTETIHYTADFTEEALREAAGMPDAPLDDVIEHIRNEGTLSEDIEHSPEIGGQEWTWERVQPAVFTVVGMWLNGEPVVAGVIPGRHDVSGGQDGGDDGEHQPWAVVVETDDPDDAEALAITELTGDDDL